MLSPWIEAIRTNPDDAARLIRELADKRGWSLPTTYRKLASEGYRSGRKRRIDSGQTRLKENDLERLAGYLRSGVRANGKETLHIPTARSVLEANGDEFKVSDSRLRRLLKEKKIDMKTRKTPKPHIQTRSPYPNYLHQVDPSLCLLYYLPSGKQEAIDDREAYKNKPFMQGKEKLKIWRYVLTDHYSCSVYVRYYRSAGETMENLFDFLLRAWSKKEDPAFQFHGVPEYLLWDRGSANISGPISRAVSALGVKTETHLPGNPRGKGQVEVMNNIIECMFESRLKAEPVKSLEELNDAAERFCSAYNTGSVGTYDSRLRRNNIKTSRLSLWLTIRHENLKELPEIDLCRGLLTTEPVIRKIGGDLLIHYRHPRAGKQLYSVSGLTSLFSGMEVEIRPLLLKGRSLIRILWKLYEKEYTAELEPVELDEAGFLINAPVPGAEFKSHRKTEQEKKEEKLEEEIGGFKQPFKDKPFRTHSFIKPSGSRPIERTGEMLPVKELEEKRMTAVAAVKRFKQKTGYLPDNFLKEVQKQFPEGMSEEEFKAILKNREEKQWEALQEL